ncbi:MAG: thiosulfohydrolase SoxB [Bradyrhizobium sp.]|uniref:thiosulfohydrolase SoxB n=1 Tax=Bradyrhizobium sp. TaxID=376 RepID=UPI001C2840DF|nr:thiosulfohydrolase SoxB [Bradyrhizobium sp.]MBU6463455.1 thiosulfohydrolase SoxB [Pseudomonadota bacterium]MDE2067066.1 thiosulfohydrolase SoxB [Bradyrhizobium sp.]MDE2243778.1 thiosulfohydrolase SoxB [Bradyrhizobium sp.]
MTIRRRDFLKFAGAVTLSGGLSRAARAADNARVYDLERFGNVRILHMTDTHAQLQPVYFREPSVNLGIGAMQGKPPHLVGRAFLDRFGIRADSADAYAFTCLDFEKSAARFGKLGGFAHLKTLIDRLRGDAGSGRALLLDGGDLWQGTGQANATQGADMVDAANLLGIEAMTGHWEFTYGEAALRKNLERFKGEFLAQNVFLTAEAAFNDAKAFDPASGRVFKPSLVKEIGGHRVAVIGQAFPYVPIAHPKRFTPDWTFGIRDDELQKLVDGLRNNDKVDAVVLLSHNGMDVDLKLASKVSGIDVILGGHTHDAIPQPITVNNPGGVTLVTNAGSNGKFLGVLDLNLAKGKVSDVRYRLLPVFSELLKPDPAMQALIDKSREPFATPDAEKIATADRLLYRRGNFSGTMDRLICNALRGELDVEIALSPGFRWGTSMMPGQPVTMQDVLAETAITYPETYVQSMTGIQIKDILEDVCDNLFNADPYYQQGGDMVRVGGMSYTCSPNEGAGKRISALKLDNGRTIEAGKSYKVAGWASVNQQKGTPVWDVVARHLRSGKRADGHDTDVTLRGVDDNPGLSNQG